MNQATQRKSLIAKVHIAKKQLGLDDEDYRQIIASVSGGKTSSAQCDILTLQRLLQRFEALGWSPEKKATGGKLSPKTSHKPEHEKTPIDKIRALWITLAQQGKVQNRYEEGLRKWIERQTGVARLEWLTAEQQQKCLEALKQMEKRKTSAKT